MSSRGVRVSLCGCGSRFCSILIFFEISGEHAPSLDDLVSLFDSSFGVLGTLTRLRSELFDDVIPVAALSLELHPPLLPPEPLDLYLSGRVPS